MTGNPEVIVSLSQFGIVEWARLKLGSPAGPKHLVGSLRVLKVRVPTSHAGEQH